MAQSAPSSNPSITRLILVPSIITLAITITRLVGELQHWSSVLFNSSAGGGGAIVGIVWLPFIFGPYFAVKLVRSNQGPGSLGKTIGLALLGIGVVVGGGIVGFAPQVKFPGKEWVGLVLMIIGGLLAWPGWPALFKTLLAYGYAARIPVAIVMFFAIRGNWGTHYDGPPPGYPANVPFWTKYLQIAIAPQLIFWIAFTVLIGSLFGGIAAALARRGKPATQAA